ncbi:isoprenylcysteine carboxylmethyltransferase family protein [Pseudoxanthomonas sp. LH2527]|uniref:methyltransferase family protein n=1 Tax=Pseudoxanthomonas sp. LH2527 TaxID=2923249 RepID=UPI001F144E9E|nr:isoprenylcysteine carboxylmethyltransferase family protein [Pseudoxanthomonas sp. LH2527]MCH6482348.1 isoprenylcysteine carboxylmethyltransferase family protein [Pseudoxanthomonas sp. LH2527]
MVLCGAVAWVVAYALPAGIIALPPSLRVMLVASLAALGLLFNLSPKLAFGRAGTTVNPLSPASSRVLVITGLHRLSRNPMYLGHALLLVAWACWLQHPAALIGAPLYMAYVTRYQILPEERALSATFGAAYEAYQARVRRWL